MKRRSILLHIGAAITGAALALAGAAAAQTKLTVYTALENEQLKPYKEAFEKANPGIEIVWVRDSTGIITARLLAEKDNPRADVVWGLSASSIVLFEQNGMLLGYTPKGADALKPQFRDSKDPAMWTGMDAYASVVCFNTKEGEAKKVKAPVSWQDLTKPDYKGMIVMPNPASSGTGFLTVAAWLQVMGEKAGWEFMDRLHQNIAVYTHSGSAPCVQAARGERVMGIGFDMRGASEKTKGAPLDLVVPKEGAGWEMEATAIVKGTKNLEAAKKLVDFSVTKQMAEMYGKYYAIVAHKDVKAAPPNYPGAVEANLVKNDLGWMAKERARILAEWTKRYDTKSEPKKQ
jgi:iron(III) transport system substrate-binding protein